MSEVQDNQNAIRRAYGNLVSLSDIRRHLPGLHEPADWLRSEDGRRSVANAAKLLAGSLPTTADAPGQSGESDEDEDIEIDDFRTLVLEVGSRGGGVFAAPRIVFDYLFGDDVFRAWCEAVASSASAQGSWDDVTYDLVCDLVLHRINGMMRPGDVAGLFARREAQVSLVSLLPAPVGTLETTTEKRVAPRKKVATYFVEAELVGLIKIGKSNNIPSRLSSLQCGSPVRLRVLGALRGDCESELHARFEAHRSHGEWFKPSAELLTLIESGLEDWKRVHEWCISKDGVAS